jgi:NTP pyrophosphatase (non-canonical NTP hydrolase)
MPKHPIDLVLQRKLLEEIVKERDRQDKLHGSHNKFSPERWLVILTEEVGEVSHAVLEQDLLNYHEELVQVAAVALAALENLCLELAKVQVPEPKRKARHVKI